jgi:hypothetical protein
MHLSCDGSYGSREIGALPMLRAEVPDRRRWPRGRPPDTGDSRNGEDGIFLMTRIATAHAVATQAAAEYVAIAGRSALGKVQVMAGQVTNWIDTQPGLAWSVAGVILLLFWITRKR